MLHSIKTPNKRTFSLSPIILTGLDQMNERCYLLRDLNIEKGSLVGLVGAGNTGKTMFAQYLATSVCSSKDFLGKQIQGKNLKVLHIDQEQSAAQTQRRYERIAAGMGVKSLSIIRMVMPYALDQMSNDEITELTDECREYDFIIVDSLRKSTACDENNSQITVALTLLKHIAEECNNVVLVIHHKGKTLSSSAQSGRGSSAIYDSFDIQMDLDRNDDVIELSCKKNRDSIYWDTIIYQMQDIGKFHNGQNCSEELVFEVLDYKQDNKQIEKQVEILETLQKKNEPMGMDDFSDVASKPTIRKMLPDMLQQHLLEEVFGGKKRLFSLGINASEFLSKQAYK